MVWTGLLGALGVAVVAKEVIWGPRRPRAWPRRLRLRDRRIVNGAAVAAYVVGP